MKNILIASVLGGIVIIFVWWIVFMVRTIDSNDNTPIIINDGPSYEQGYFDGMNSTFYYLDSTNQMDDNATIHLEYFLDAMDKKEIERLKEQNEIKGINE